jgi:hypothetical protein
LGLFVAPVFVTDLTTDGPAAPDRLKRVVVVGETVVPAESRKGAIDDAAQHRRRLRHLMELPVHVRFLVGEPD